jgi:hypothetical protein
MRYDAEEKYQSVLRAHARLIALASDIGKTAIIGDQAAKDATTAFFMECYHLKDWLKKDSRITPTRAIEDCITNSPALSLAADLCNSFKHGGLDRTPRSGAQLDQVNMAYSLDISITEPGTVTFTRQPSPGDTITLSRSRVTGRPIATARIILTIGGVKYDAPELASRRVNEWDAFFVSYGIQFAK